MRMAPINTDLNVPPPQVLDSAYYEAFRKRSRKFFKTSLDMGYSFANDVPSVNIVGSGSAIKKLLMEPYAAGPLSLICHRVGKTVYLDNHSFTRKQKCELLPQLYWKDEEPSPNFTPQLSLYENLIWNSPITSTCTEPGAGAELVLRETGLAASSSTLDFPKMFNSYSYRITSENNPGGLAHLWEFHDFRMLVDVDLPIFGGGRFPSVSIHLSEETKPISVLTGMDIMLDQLMCNLSETILVYHQQGLVKEYEVLVKEEIPHIVGSEFDPSNLKNITENIMSFLSKNMTEQGHTYWLFREKGSSQMKLYDLTSICPDLAGNPNWNPFLVPVITLLYKLALDLMEKSAKGRSEKLSNVIYGLLNAAAKLAENEDLAEMRACIHHSLAGVYLMYGSGEGSLEPEFSNLIDSLDEVLTDGYARLTSAIQVASLTRSSSCCSYETDQTTRSNSSSKRPPNAKVESECSIQALEHCLQALNALEGVEVDVRQACPFKPDSPDEVAALRSFPICDNTATRRVFRHAVLIRAASAYLPLVYQSMCLDRHLKTYNFSRCGTTLCGAVLSTKPAARHASICHGLLQVLLSALGQGASELVDDVVDTTVLNNAISYRDRRFLELATFDVTMKGVLNFSSLWFEGEAGEKTRNEWIDQVEAICFRCFHFLKEYPTAQSQITFAPVASGLSPFIRNVSRVAMTLMTTGGKCTQIAQNEFLDGLGDRASGDRIMEFVTVAKRFFKDGLDVLSHYNNKQLRDCEVVLYANSAATLRLEYSTIVTIYKESPTTNSVVVKIDEVCAAYRKIFEVIRMDFETQNGCSIYANSLVDFGIVLSMFADHLKDEADAKWKEKRIHYMEASIRALGDACKRSCPRSTRSKAREKMTEIYYILLRIKTDAIASKANFVSTKVCRGMYKELADFIQVVNDHLIQLCYEDIWKESKNIPLCMADFTIALVPAATLGDTQKIDLCIQLLQWLMGLASNITEIDPDPEKALERYGKVWDRAQRLLRTMNQEWRNNPTMKQAYVFVLSKLPNDTECARTFVIESIAKAITALGGKQLHPLGPA
ncbi:hypothetical protein RB195_025687 [Necator americanus]